MREWRGRLLRQRLSEEARLRRLSQAETTTMIRAILADQAVGAQLAAAVHARSDGIPLHVEEFLSTAGDGERLPQTLSDAILARAERLSDRARATADAAAVIGRSFPFDPLVEVAGAPPDDVAAGLRELEERSFVQAGAEPTTWDLRHALIRDALYDALSVPTRRRLHSRVVAAAQGAPDAVVSVHCEAANLRDDAHRLARAAAAEAPPHLLAS